MQFFLDVIAGPMIMLALWPLWAAILIIAVVVITAVVIRRRKKK